MKKIISSIIAIIICLTQINICTFAQGITFDNSVDNLKISLHIYQTPSFFVDDATIGLFDCNDNLVDTQKYRITKTGNDVDLIFNFADTILGDTAYLKLLSGASKASRDEVVFGVGDKIPLSSITINNEDGSKNYLLNITPKIDNGFVVRVDGKNIAFSNVPRIIKGTSMIPVMDYLKALSIEENAKFDQTQGKVSVSYRDHNVDFQLNSNKVICDGAQKVSSCESMMLGGIFYVPLRTLVEGLGGIVNPVFDENGVFSVNTTFVKENANEKFVKNIKSKTDYLIWVSKSTFKVTVFKRAGDCWSQIQQFDCALGAPSTPTITGEFEYYAKETAWKYAKYYVGPIMRFYQGGYALHSTLLNYNGTEYDGRTGVNISHGCVRIHPQGINWLANNIPLNTKVYITK